MGYVTKASCKQLWLGQRSFWIRWKLHKSNHEERKEHFFEVDTEYPKKLHELHNDLPFLPERNNIEKVEKLVANLHDKNEYVIHKRSLKQALNQGLALKNGYRVIKFNEKAWLKSCIEINTKLRKKAKNDFKKDFFKLMKNSVFRKTMKNARKHRDIKLVITKKEESI